MATIQQWGSAGCSANKPHPGSRLSEEEFIAWCDEDVKAELLAGTPAP